VVASEEKGDGHPVPHAMPRNRKGRNPALDNNLPKVMNQPKVPNKEKKEGKQFAQKKKGVGETTRGLGGTPEGGDFGLKKTTEDSWAN